MHRDHTPLRAPSRTGLVPSLILELDQMLDEFTRLPVRAEFTFDPEEPALIRVEFLAGRGPGLIWYIGRELLQHGLTAMSGSGDVRMWPTLPGERPSSWLLLESQDVEALFELPRDRLAAWLDTTYRVAPAGTELDGLDWDGFLTGLLGGRGPAST
ncbi:SsgA family sporulation/cell division regulator [Streptomyces sp. NPDC020983]|uniref:SsgA family sporulation/cell division regulator n=1 Tax=Streptomyces sp. NPDC020983 TaxID=3365106 RepID=UPI003795E5C7